MHLIISIIIGIVFVCLFVKAIIETIWGLCLIAYGTACQLAAIVLRILAKIIRLTVKTRHQTPVTKEPEPLGVVSSFMLVNSYSKEQSDRLSPAPQNRKTKVCLKQH